MDVLVLSSMNFVWEQCAHALGIPYLFTHPSWYARHRWFTHIGFCFKWYKVSSFKMTFFCLLMSCNRFCFSLRYQYPFAPIVPLPLSSHVLVSGAASALILRSNGGEVVLRAGKGCACDRPLLMGKSSGQTLAARPSCREIGLHGRYAIRL